MLKAVNRPIVVALACLVLGCALRFVGLTRGTSDFALPSPARSGSGEAFYNFHPDEETLVRAALQLQSPFEPPLTAYGMLPMYLARGVLEVTSLVPGNRALDLDSPEERFTIFFTIRILAAVLSCLSLWLVYLIGRQCFGWQVACLSLFFVAVAPVAVQQAHFYTVDGVFKFLVLIFLHVTLKALETPQRWRYALSGALVGAAGAVRLNGLLLGVVLLAGHLMQGGAEEDGTGFNRLRRRLKQGNLWLAGLAAELVVLLLQPFLVTSPGLLQRADSTDDLLYSIQVARGEFLRLWSLVDVHTVPYLHYWTTLWPLGVGWPLTGVFVLGIGYALWRRSTPGLLLLLWTGIYFLLIGGLHTKHVRYLLPLLPFLSWLAADFCCALCRMKAVVWRRLGVVLVVGVVVYTGVYGLAFARIYTVEDSRIQAGRWIGEHVPAGTVIGVERGGFSLRRLVDQEQHQPQYLGLSAIFGTRGYLTCEVTRQLLKEVLQHIDYIAIVDVNRYQQFTAVTDLYPVMASFYQKLLEGELGFELVQRFKTYPALGGIEFRDDGAEPSFLGYDHPAVLVFKRLDHFDQAWTEWQQELEIDPRCVDGMAREMAAAVRAGDVTRTLNLIQSLSQDYPEARFAALIETGIHHLRGNTKLGNAVLRRYLWSMSTPSHTAYLIPWASGRSLGDLGLNDQALDALRIGVQLPIPSVERPPMALSYISLGDYFYAKDEPDYAVEVYRMSTQIHTLPAACNILARMAYKAGRLGEALEWGERSLELDDTQVEVYKSTGKAAYEQQAYERALRYLGRAVQLDPSLTSQKRVKDYNALAETALRTGQFEQALALWERSVELDGTQVRVHVSMGMAAGKLEDFARALAHLERALELDPGLGAELGGWIKEAKSRTGP